ncbi:hypothetical protein EDC01DRAFT_627528 [Geopyxis carbonaria]|nr:hypothetical protein EDC01DRAFT_627528 [Geopyxis carbonaria]
MSSLVSSPKRAIVGAPERDHFQGQGNSLGGTPRKDILQRQMNSSGGILETDYFHELSNSLAINSGRDLGQLYSLSANSVNDHSQVNNPGENAGRDLFQEQSDSLAVYDLGKLNSLSGNIGQSHLLGDSFVGNSRQSSSERQEQSLIDIWEYPQELITYPNPFQTAPQEDSQGTAQGSPPTIDSDTGDGSMDLGDLMIFD